MSLSFLDISANAFLVPNVFCCNRLRRRTFLAFIPSFSGSALRNLGFPPRVALLYTCVHFIASGGRGFKGSLWANHGDAANAWLLFGSLQPILADFLQRLVLRFRQFQPDEQRTRQADAQKDQEVAAGIAEPVLELIEHDRKQVGGQI